jgi:hypothetical protein
MPRLFRLRRATMTSAVTQDSINGEQKINDSIDVEQQQKTGTLLVETPKTLGAGVCLTINVY